MICCELSVEFNLSTDTSKIVNRKITRNAPSSGTESSDRIGKSPSGLGEAITSTSKNDVLVILPSQILQRCMISPQIGLRQLRPRSSRSQFQDMTFVHVISCT